MINRTKYGNSVSSRIASVFLAAAWRSFAATQCRKLPTDPLDGIAALISQNGGGN